MSNTAKLAQLQRELDRAKRLDANDPALDWKAYSLCKSAILEIASLLPPEMALLSSSIVGTIDNVYLSRITEGE